MKRSTFIVMGVVLVLFVISWFLKAASFEGESDNYLMQGFLVTLSAFLTLAVLSFLYQDNPFYKFAEHLFVGISAAFCMCVGFWTTIVQNLLPRLSDGFSDFFDVVGSSQHRHFARTN